MKIDIRNLDTESLNEVYGDMAEIIGLENVYELYRNYKGLQITFPTRLLKRDYVKQQVLLEYDGTNIKELASKYGYTERWLRGVLRY